MTLQIQLYKDSLCSLGHGPHRFGHILDWIWSFSSSMHSFLFLYCGGWRAHRAHSWLFAARILNVNHISPLRISYWRKISRWKWTTLFAMCDHFLLPRKAAQVALSTEVLLGPQLCGVAFLREATGEHSVLCWVISFAEIKGILRVEGSGKDHGSMSLNSVVLVAPELPFLWLWQRLPMGHFFRAQGSFLEVKPGSFLPALLLTVLSTQMGPL